MLPISEIVPLPSFLTTLRIVICNEVYPPVLLHVAFVLPLDGCCMVGANISATKLFVWQDIN
jgi:hypothetical protein